MDMPDDVLLHFINLRYAFFDKKSKEEGTDRIKAKYKLLTQKNMTLRELGIFVFHILTTTEDSYIKSKTIDIHKSDWEYRCENHLSAKCSKLCAQKVDFVNKDVLLQKIRDSENGFSHVGILKQTRFREITDFIKESFESTDIKTDFDVKEIITALFNNKAISEKVTKKFDI